MLSHRGSCACPASGQPIHWPGRRLGLLAALAGCFFAADLAVWHVGIHMTKLGNAMLFANTSSLIFAVWGLWLARRRPSAAQVLALTLAAVGAALLMSSSAELSTRNLTGDALTLLAGLIYTGYLITVQRVRKSLQALPTLFIASLFSGAILLPVSLILHERVLPADWTFVAILALSCQVVGQTLVVYAIGALSPLVVGLTLLTQPAIAALIGWLAYGEALTPIDTVGALAIAAALVLVRLPQRGPSEAVEQPS